jgi:hypothetical protein
MTPSHRFDPDTDLTTLRATRRYGESARGTDCLDDITLAEFVAGFLEPESHRDAMRHVAACPTCRQSIADVVRLTGKSGEAGAIVPTRWNRRILGLGIAAAVLIVAGIQVLPSPDSGHRSPITAAPAPVPLAPVNDVEAVAAFRWAAVDGADQYRVTLYDANGVVRYEATVATDSMVLPDSVVLAPGVATWWRIDARLGFDRWVASPLVEFTINGPRQQ